MHAKHQRVRREREMERESGIAVVLQRTDVKQTKVERAIEFKQMWLYLLLNISEIKNKGGNEQISSLPST